MNDQSTTLPPRLSEIVDDFQFAEGREKLELLLEYSEKMPPLPDWLAQDHSQMDQVHECMTPVFVHAERKGEGLYFYFDIPPESPTVRGFASLLAEGLNGLTPQEILQVPGDFYLQMGLDQALSHQRLNGISAMLAYIKRLAARYMD
jgi:cysteine desulfuration protein SufE